MKKNLKILSIGLLLCFVVFIIICIIIINRFNSYLDNYDTVNIIQRLPSLDGNLAILKFTRDVNATTKTSYNLSVVKNDKSQRIDDIQYVSDCDFDVCWGSNNEIIVCTHKNSVSYKNDSFVKIAGRKVKIKYKIKAD